MGEMFENDESARFFQVIHMFQRSILLQMGMIPDQEGLTHYNMNEAKEGIEVLRMLEKKTEGNLTAKEKQLLRTVFSELQLQFTRAPHLHQQKQHSKDQETILKETFTHPSAGPHEDLGDLHVGEEE